LDSKKLAALKDELLRDLEAVERVEKLMASKNGLLSKPDKRQMTLPISSNKHAEAIENATEDAADAPKDSLRGTIERIINEDPSERWTTQKMLAHLRSISFPLRAEQPIYSVGQSLNVLVKKGKIRLARKGGGSAPNIYKGKASDAL